MGVIAAVILALITLTVSNYFIRAEQARTKTERDRFEQAQGLAEKRAAEVRQGLERLAAANALLDRGNWYVSQRRWDDAHEAFSRAIELHREHVSVWIARGDLYASLGLWDLASNDFGEAIAIQEPDATMRWYRHALLRLYLDDEEGYDEARRRMRERFQGTIDINLATELARTYVLTGDERVDFGPFAELAGHAAVAEPGVWYRLYILGIAQYRDGKYEQAAEALTMSLTGAPDWSGRALSYPVLAMAHHRLGHAAEARRRLDQATEASERWLRIRYRPNATDWAGHWIHNLGAMSEWPIAWWDWLEFNVYYREACELIDGEAPPYDPRMQVMRARAFAGLRKNFTADAEYALALTLLPEDRVVQLEAHRSAGYSAIGRRQWQRAAAEFSKANALSPDDPTLWRFVASAQFAAGNRAAYRQVCAAMMERFERTKDPRTAGELLRASVLASDALDDMSRLLPLMEASDAMWHWGAWARGAALYRSGKYAECVVCLDAAAKIHVPRAWDWCFLAMAHQRLGHTQDATRCLAEAERWIDEANRRERDRSFNGGDDVTLTLPNWMEWGDAVVSASLLQEARDELKRAAPLHEDLNAVQAPAGSAE
jgi:tetratricopeptide (TPR) repeat protein